MWRICTWYYLRINSRLKIRHVLSVKRMIVYIVLRYLKTINSKKLFLISVFKDFHISPNRHSIKHLFQNDFLFIFSMLLLMQEENKFDKFSFYHKCFRILSATFFNTFSFLMMVITYNNLCILLRYLHFTFPLCFHSLHKFTWKLHLLDTYKYSLNIHVIFVKGLLTSYAYSSA